jgi:hypothetical protein
MWCEMTTRLVIEIQATELNENGTRTWSFNGVVQAPITPIDMKDKTAVLERLVAIQILDFVTAEIESLGKKSSCN